MEKSLPLYLKSLFTAIILSLTLFANAQTPDANNTLYIDINVSGGNGSGNSWANAIPQLADALKYARQQDNYTAANPLKIYVAKGTYKPMYGAAYNAFTTNGDRKNSFVLVKNVQLYGGFDPAAGIANLTNTRIFDSNGSILSGDLGNVNDDSDNAYHVAVSAGEMDNARLDGFTLTKGNANGGPEMGVQIVSFSENPSAINSYYGGGMYNVNSNLIIANVNIIDNKASNPVHSKGGGMFNENSSLVLTNMVISNNSASVSGGGIMNWVSLSFTLTNSKITGNTVAKLGGGIYNSGGAGSSAPFVVYNTEITGNQTGSNGGIFANESGDVTLTNVTIAANEGNAVTSGGGSAFHYNNSIIYGEIFDAEGLSTSQNSLIEGRSETSNGNVDATGITEDNLFTNASGGDFSLRSYCNSPVIDKGSNALYSGLNASTKDFAGNLRLLNGIIDIGAYEFYLLPDADGIIYVADQCSGSGNGSSWANATTDLHNAINTAGVQKVFVAVGNYPVGANSFVMKNNVAIYGGFDPANGITDLTHKRIMPNASNTQGSVLDGEEDTRPVIWNVFTAATALNNTAVLDGFTITKGSYANGGGIRNVYASPTLKNMVVSGNSATVTGAGIYNDNSSPLLTNAIISGNAIVNLSAFPFANVYGAGMYNTNSSAPVLSNTTVTGNTLQALGIMGGAGIYSNNSSAPKIYNSIIWNNLEMGSPFIAGADIENSSATVTLKNSMTQTYATGNTADNNKVNVDPLFISTTDFGLQVASPAINAGSNALFTGLDTNTKDLAGSARVYNYANGIIDMGAYESGYGTPIASNAGVVYVKETASGTQSGNSWVNATADLQRAIDATGTTKVFVAVGNYPVGDNSFVMKNGVAIYGGFDPDHNIKTLDDARILSSLAVSGSVLNGENARRVIDNNFTSATAVNATAILDGFIITGGKASDGGGIYNNYASPVLNNLVFEGNTVTANGGGIRNGNSSPVISNTIFKNNSANRGGGIFNTSSSPVLKDIEIIENTAYQGGGILNENSNAVTLTNIKLKKNNVSGSGSAIYGFNSTITVTNAEITGNTGNTGVQTNGGKTKLNNVTIANNGANAMNISNGGTAAINNAIVFGTLNGTGYTAQYSFIQGNSDTSNGNLDATGIALADIFTNPSGGDYMLKQGSPVFNKGNNQLYWDAVGGGTSLPSLEEAGWGLDLAGNPRLAGTTIDFGAYESPIVLTHTATGIIYINADAQGVQDGSSWENATAYLHNAIHVMGVQKVFVAVGEYKVGDNSFVMKNGVAIYGGFDPANGITNLTHKRIMPNASNTQGSILNGENTRPVIWNVFTSLTTMNNTAVLDGFTITGGSYSNGAGIRNVYASPILRNLVIRGNNATTSGAGIYNENSSPLLTNAIISGNAIVNLSTSPFANVYGAGIYNTNSSAPVLTNTTVTGNTLQALGATGGAGIYSNNSSAPQIYNSIIWNNLKVGSPFIAGADIENSSATVTLKNSITQTYTTGNTGDNNLVNINPLFANSGGNNYTLQSTSPAINAGSNSFYIGLDANAKDLAGNSRVYNTGTIDIGAYEYQGEGTLLVTLINFTAKADGNHAKLQWQTASESNNKGFIIYRSSDGKTFVQTGEKQGVGTSATTNNYTFYDNAPLNGNNYYQLVQVDNNGKTTDLGVRTVNFGLQTSDIRLYPNPTENQFTVSFEAGKFSQLELVDLNGRVLQQVIISSIENSKTLSLVAYPTGIYVVKLSGKGIVESRKVIKR